MFSQILSSVAVALAAASAVQAVPHASGVRRSHHGLAIRAQPAGWATGYLENYTTYHTRYLALDCEDKHNTTFFDSCCHPLLATEKLSSRPSNCTPSAAALSSAAKAEPTSTVSTPADAECEEESTSSTPAPKTSSTPAPKAAATTTSKPAPAPATTSHTSTTAKPAANTFKAESSSSATKTSTSAKSIASDLGDLIKGGVATFFYQNGVAGACGTTHSDNDFIAAIDSQRYGNTGEKSSLCGKQVLITNTKNQKQVTVTIADACPTCNNAASIDLSKAAFTSIATEEEGEVSIEWKFV
ncbi:hypothetical protein PLICRDRAFT_623982 [Plicaturopsis crispa FD-325 SS-3]|nr:hypothetical protein PLICRDRAFT_623982 [Plicaturopsis crispa FD-325 SS-3]